MKIKEVCIETGLSRKTIRLYEEKGLLKPKTVRINGRDFRDYSQEDVERLKTIAVLRKAWFTMDEIRRMQEDPEAIGQIFPQYRQWLRQQKQDIDQLLSVVEQVDPEHVASIGELKAAMAAAADALPLPTADIRPRFRYLDEMEEIPRELPAADPTDRVMAGDKATRQAAVSLSRDKRDDALVKLNVLNDTVHMLKNEESGPVQREAEKEPLWLRLISGLLTILLVVATFGFIRDFVTYRLTMKSILFFVVAFGLRGGIFYWQHLLEQEAWLKRMGLDTGKFSVPDEKTVKRVLLAVLGLAVVILGIVFGARALKNSTQVDFCVTVITRQQEDPYTAEILQGAIGYFVGDQNGDGIVKIRVEYVLPEDYDPRAQELVILSSKDMPEFYYEDKLMELPEGVANSQRPTLADISWQKFWDIANLEGQKYYGGVPRILDEREEQFSIEILRLLQTTSIPYQFYVFR